MTTVTTPQEALNEINLYDFSTVSVDVETIDTKWYNRWAHGGSYEEGQPTGISFYNGEYSLYIDTCGWTDEDMELVVDALKTQWQNGTKAKGTTIIAHNLLFDIGCLYKYGLKLWGAEWFDTLTAAHLLDENRSQRGHNGLKALAREYLNEEDPIPWVEARFDKEVFQKYATNDAKWAFKLAEIFSDEMRVEGLEELFRHIEMPFQVCLLQMQVNGVLVDLEKVHKIKGELEIAKEETEQELLNLLGLDYEYKEKKGGKVVKVCPVNFRSSQQLQKILFEDMELEVIEYTGTGKPSTGKATLNAHRSNPFVAVLIKYKVIEKLLSAFFIPMPKLVDPDGRLRPEFKNTGTVTGRLSCRKPNLQQLPNVNDDFPVETRACFIVPEGKKMVACDFSQQEVRIMAHLSQDEKLISILLNQGDIHLFSANNAFQLGIDEDKLYKSHPEYGSILKKHKKDRSKGKVFSFGVPYGMTEHKAAKDFGISPEEGKKLMDNFFSGFPQLDAAIKQTHKQAERDLYVRTYTGRKRRFKRGSWGRLDPSALRQSFNFLIQSFGADLMRKAQVRLLAYSARNKHMGIKQIMSVHDEVVFEVNEEYAEQAAKDAEKLFEGVWDLCVPLIAEADVGDNYAQAK